MIIIFSQGYQTANRPPKNRHPTAKYRHFGAEGTPRNIGAPSYPGQRRIVPGEDDGHLRVQRPGETSVA
jgi:hypothetical protein